jgi:hypothetical protein
MVVVVLLVSRSKYAPGRWQLFIKENLSTWTKANAVFGFVFNGNVGVVHVHTEQLLSFRTHRWF